MSDYDPVREIDPFNKELLPRLVLVDLDDFLIADTSPEGTVRFVLDKRFWQLFGCTSITINPPGLPVMALLCRNFRYRDLFPPRSKDHVWYGSWHQHAVGFQIEPDRDRLLFFEDGGLLRSVSAPVKVYDRDWLASNARDEPHLAVLHRLGFDTDCVLPESGRPIAEDFASGEILAGTSGYQEVAVVTLHDIRAFRLGTTT